MRGGSFTPRHPVAVAAVPLEGEKHHRIELFQRSSIFKSDTCPEIFDLHAIMIKGLTRDLSKVSPYCKCLIVSFSVRECWAEVSFPIGLPTVLAQEEVI